MMVLDYDDDADDAAYDVSDAYDDTYMLMMLI